MATGSGLPTFDEHDRTLFSIEDPRERADALRDLLVPKLAAIHGYALGRVREVYRGDPQEGSSKRPSVSPDHRKNAVTTREVHAAYVGLVGAQVGGKYISPKLSFLLSSEGLSTVLWLNKAWEADELDRVIRRHEGPIKSLLGSMDRPSLWAGPGAMDYANSGPLLGLPESNPAPLYQYWNLGLCGRLHQYPIEVDRIAERLAADYVALFPVYKTVVDVLHGEEDCLPALFGRFEDWLRGQRDDLALVEGDAVRSYRWHRRREKRLRKAKIREALARGDGRLRCEVPGCGFDFFEVYGEVGREFAHVHHLEPLGERDDATVTSLADLAIVCANCHAMIHRGKTSRPLEGLITRAVPPVTPS